MRHTATPWRAAGLGSDRYRIRAANGDIIADMWSAMSAGQRAANRLFILRACNAFDDLSELAQRVADAGSTEELSDAMDNARALVARWKLEAGQ